MSEHIKLGDKVRDRVSGFTGVATGRAEYLYTTPTVQVTPEAIGSDGKLIGSVLPSWQEHRRGAHRPSLAQRPEGTAHLPAAAPDWDWLAWDICDELLRTSPEEGG